MHRAGKTRPNWTKTGATVGPIFTTLLFLPPVQSAEPAAVAGEARQLFEMTLVQSMSVNTEIISKTIIKRADSHTLHKIRIRVARITGWS